MTAAPEPPSDPGQSGSKVAWIAYGQDMAVTRWPDGRPITTGDGRDAIRDYIRKKVFDDAVQEGSVPFDERNRGPAGPLPPAFGAEVRAAEEVLADQLDERRRRLEADFVNGVAGISPDGFAALAKAETEAMLDELPAVTTDAAVDDVLERASAALTALPAAAPGFWPYQARPLTSYACDVPDGQPNVLGCVANLQALGVNAQAFYTPTDSSWRLRIRNPGQTGFIESQLGTVLVVTGTHVQFLPPDLFVTTYEPLG